MCARPSVFAGALQEADEWKHRYEQQQLQNLKLVRASLFSFQHFGTQRAIVLT